MIRCSLLLLVFLVGCVHGQPARVVRVIDGDTIVVALQGRDEHVRLYGVDTPERGQPGYYEAAGFTRGWCAAAGGVVELEGEGGGRGKWGRLLGWIWSDGQLLNRDLLDAGLATPLMLDATNHPERLVP